MTHTELKEKVDSALELLKNHDSALLGRNASEWSIAHRLAVYLEQVIPGWHVDCEYNRQGEEADIKKMANDDKVRPDIIIHRRGHLEPANNLLVIEIKKHENDSDLLKACEYTRQPEGKRKFQYQFGLALSLLPAPNPHWFRNGNVIS